MASLWDLSCSVALCLRKPICMLVEAWLWVLWLFFFIPVFLLFCGQPAVDRELRVCFLSSKNGGCCGGALFALWPWRR